MYVTSEKSLRELYGFTKGRAKDKQLAALERHCRHFIEHSPFAVISTYEDSGSVDCY